LEEKEIFEVEGESNMSVTLEMLPRSFARSFVLHEGGEEGGIAARTTVTGILAYCLFRASSLISLGEN